MFYQPDRYRPDRDEAPAFNFSAPLPEAEWMTASEQMFFLGSPLAHVVCYEEELRSDRIRRAVNLGLTRRQFSNRQLGGPEVTVR